MIGNAAREAALVIQDKLARAAERLTGHPAKHFTFADATLTSSEDASVAVSYFDALTSHDRSVALAHEGCGRAENGSPAPGGAFLPPAGGGAPPAVGETRDCLAGLEGFNLSMVQARRIPVVDVEAQVVLSFGVFIRRPGSPTPRNVFSEWFVIDEAKIRTIYTSMFYPPPTLAVPNWPPYVGNWPLPAAIVPEQAP